MSPSSGPTPAAPAAPPPPPNPPMFGAQATKKKGGGSPTSDFSATALGTVPGPGGTGAKTLLGQ